MKAITLILSFYVMVMAVMPCCMFDNCPGDREEIQQVAKEDHKEHSSGDEDGCGTCSPFFACSSCSISIDLVLPFHFALQPAVALESPLKFELYETHFISSFFNSFWQPPKIA